MGTRMPAFAARNCDLLVMRRMDMGRAVLASARLQSGRQGFAATGTAGTNDSAATNGCHARTETVAAGADKVARLECTLHDNAFSCESK